ncbi:hypothetical protein [Paenibacillus sp. HW567]|uniref:hypothetical protein n=1 Tax=Paenibacillus sp. HW567 TaxID=1034769 RepID=UPI000374FC3B|nr:hypothetical protein [Paenibacillus sp. HW567]
MGNEFNKTEADFEYERYTKMGGVHEAPIDLDGVVDDGSDPALVGDHILAADIGLNAPEPVPELRADRNVRLTSPPPPGRDELLESDALFAAGAAGLTGSAFSYAEGEESPAEAGEEEPPLEDIPDADELQPGTSADPAAPPVDGMPGIDILNGSTGEED